MMATARRALDCMRAIDAAWNERRWDDYADLLADDLVAHLSGEAIPHGKAEHVEKARHFCAAFPDAYVHSEPYLELFASYDGRMTCSVARITGTAVIDLPLPDGAARLAAGRTFETTFTVICRWQHGRIVAQYEYIDMKTAMHNLRLPSDSQLDERDTEMTGTIIENERTALSQKITNQPDGPGKRIGTRGELTMIGNVLPGGAELFRQRLPQFQAEAAYWEDRVGTVQDFRILLFDNDTRFILTVVYDGDFKPYLQDITCGAGPWLDSVGPGVLEGYPGMESPEVGAWVLSLLHPAEFFYASNPDVTVRDITKMKKLSKAVSDMLDAAS